MPRKQNLSTLTVDALLKLRDKIGDVLSARANDLKNDLLRLTGGDVGNRKRRGPGQRGPRKGMKVAPKYRGPGGELWSGRGLKPRWLTAEMKKGRKLARFAIE